MKIDPNDYRITAYILNELDAEERAKFEKEIEGCEESRALIEETRRTADRLTEELGRETAPALDTARKAKIEKKLAAEPRGWTRFLFDWRVGVMVPAAACVLLVLANQAYYTGRERDAREIQEIVETAAQNRPAGIAGMPAAPVAEDRNNLFYQFDDSSKSEPAEAPVVDSFGRAKTVEEALVSQLSSNDGLAVLADPSLSSQPEGSRQLALSESDGPAPPLPGVASGPEEKVQLALTSAGQPIAERLGEVEMRVAGSAPPAAARPLLRKYDPYRVESEQDQIPKLAFVYGNEVQPDLSYPGGEDYAAITDNAFKDPLDAGYSTFSIDVDTAAYANVRRYLNSGSLPPKDAVRIEEMINYFDYDYPSPDGEAPFSSSIEVAGCPWNPEHRLARIGLQGKEVAPEERGPANLVFLIDVSGSMQPENKLPLLKKGLRMLVDQLEPKDRVAIVTYAGSSGLALESTSLEKRETILEALESFEAGGSTNGGDGIRLAYKTAREHFQKEGINRVILATDGDFNVGVTDRNELIELIEKEAKTGVFLSVLGFGMGNLKDANLEGLANKGNGHYAYIDTLQESRKVLVEQAGSTLVTIAKDVKIQVEFNPAKVGAFRLIGYENRVMPAEHFNDDAKDAGEIGAGHQVTALYEIVPRGKEHLLGGVDPLRYQSPEAPSPEKEAALAAAAESEELLNLKLRYKPPTEDVSRLLEFPVKDAGEGFEVGSTDFRFAASVASFGMLLRDSEHKGAATYASTVEWAREARGEDRHGYRAEFLQLVQLAKAIAGK